MDKTDSLFLYANRKYMLNSMSILSTVYDKYKDDDGFLYITYAKD